MKPTLFRILAASISLALAVEISSIYSGIRAYRLKSTAMLTTSAALNTRAPASPLTPAESAEDNCVFLPDDSKYRGYLNGEILPLSVNGIESEIVSGVKVVPLPSKNLLVGFSDTLYRLDASRRIVWKYHESQILFDFTFIPATGLIYGTAGDGVMFILNASTGAKLLHKFYNGRAAYGVVQAFGDDQCLITSDFSGYRENWTDLDLETAKEVRTWKDEISAWRGTKHLWSRPFPPDAELVVDTGRIFAVTKTKSAVYFKEIAVPKNRDR